MKIDRQLEERFYQETERARKLLRSSDNLSKVGARNIIARYTAAIEPNFISWVAATSVSAESLQARFAAQENLQEEIEENHQAMLRSFARSAEAEPDLAHYQNVQRAVDRVRKQVARMDGVFNTALCTYLENTSGAFIPYLENLAKSLDSTNLTYTRKHGVADIEHAKQFLWALGHEIKNREFSLYSIDQASIDEAISRGHGLLKVIFRGK